MNRLMGCLRGCLRALAALGLASALPAPVAAQGASQMAERWTYSLTPYFWLPGVDAQLRYGPPPAGGSGANVGTDSEGVLEKLNMAFMLQGEARKGRFFFAGDLIVLDFGDQASVVRSVDFNPGPGPINIATGQLDAGTRTSLDAVVINAVAGRSLKQDATATLDVFAGVRYARIDVRTDWHLTADVIGPPGTATFARNGSIEKSVDLWDGIIGARGRVALGSTPWFVPYHVDLGTGSSDFTWQGAAGIGYAFGWGDLILSYRYLYYDQGDDKFIQKMEFGGFAIGARFTF